MFSTFSPKVECKAKNWQHSVKLEDNSTVIFDIFEPCPDGKSEVGQQGQLLQKTSESCGNLLVNMLNIVRMDLFEGITVI